MSSSSASNACLCFDGHEIYLRKESQDVFQRSEVKMSSKEVR